MCIRDRVEVVVADVEATMPVALLAAEENAAAADVAEAGGTVGVLLTTAAGLLKTWISVRPTDSVESDTANTPKRSEVVYRGEKVKVVALPSLLSGPSQICSCDESMTAQLRIWSVDDGRS